VVVVVTGGRLAPLVVEAVLVAVAVVAGAVSAVAVVVVVRVVVVRVVVDDRVVVDVVLEEVVVRDDVVVEKAVVRDDVVAVVLVNGVLVAVDADVVVVVATCEPCPARVGLRREVVRVVVAAVVRVWVLTRAGALRPVLVRVVVAV
jgi:hypothetical protein